MSVAHADADADADADVALDAADCARAPTAMYAVARRNGRAGTMVVGDGCLLSGRGLDGWVGGAHSDEWVGAEGQYGDAGTAGIRYAG